MPLSKRQVELIKAGREDEIILLPHSWRICDGCDGSGAIPDPERYGDGIQCLHCKVKGSRCYHDRVIPAFDEQQASGMSSWEVRRIFPRFSGQCPDCDFNETMYASTAHYVMGDW